MFIITDNLPPKKKNWRSLVVNVDHMTSKFISLQIAVDYIKPDVVIGCESKINENILPSEFFPENYRKTLFVKIEI